MNTHSTRRSFIKTAMALLPLLLPALKQAPVSAPQVHTKGDKEIEPPDFQSYEEYQAYWQDVVTIPFRLYTGNLQHSRPNTLGTLRGITP